MPIISSRYFGSMARSRPLLLVLALGFVAAPAVASQLRASRALADGGELAPGDEGEKDEPISATGGNEASVRDFPHDKNFKDAAERMVPSHSHMKKVAKGKEGEQNVKLMLNQLDVLRNYLTKLSVRHEFLMEKYHGILQGGEDKKLRRMVAEIVGEELKKREAKREELVTDIVKKVVGILKNDLGINAASGEDQDKSDEDLQKEAVQEAVQEAVKNQKEKDSTQNEEDEAEKDAEGVGGSDRVEDDFEGAEGEEGEEGQEGQEGEQNNEGQEGEEGEEGQEGEQSNEGQEEGQEGEQSNEGEEGQEGQEGEEGQEGQEGQEAGAEAGGEAGAEAGGEAGAEAGGEAGAETA